MPDYDQIAWFPLCAGLTVIGVLLSLIAWRRRGVGAGLRGFAWSLLPVAAYLTGVISLLWQFVSATAGWIGGFVIRPSVWAGVGVLGLSIVFFIVSGVLRRRGWGAKGAGAREAGAESTDQRRRGDEHGDESQPTAGGQGELEERAPAAGTGAGEPDLGEIEDILKRRGIS